MVLVVVPQTLIAAAMAENANAFQLEKIKDKKLAGKIHAY